MCTLVIGRDLPAKGVVWLAANRDEDPRRPTDPPGVLREAPRLAGGRDRAAGGTWLALRERRAAVAVLNRRPAPGLPPAPPGGDAPRSRGLLALDVAAVEAGSDGPEALAAAALEAAQRALVLDRYAPFTLLFASPAACWVLGQPGPGPARVVQLEPGWHVLTHSDLDDRDEPRTASLLRELAGWQGRDDAGIEAGLAALMRRHGGDAPAVCIHDGPMPTVSSSLIRLSSSEARYAHAEGRPCETEYRDRSELLAASSRAG